MSLPSTPPLPPSASPPTAPPPPVGPAGSGAGSGVPVIRWGIGDVIIGLTLWVLGGIVAVVVLVALGDEATALTDLSLGALTVSLVSGWFGLLGWPVIATRWKGQRSLALDFGLSIRPVDLGWGALGAVVALGVSFVGAVVWTLLSGSSVPTNTDFLPQRPGPGTVVALVLLVGVCTPVVEELFFRGLFLRSVGRRWNLAIGVLVSSIIFGMLHVQGSTLAEALFMLAVTASYGAVFALLVVRADGRLGPAIIAHMGVNIVGVLATVLA